MSSKEGGILLEEENNVVKDESAIKKYVSSKEQIKRDDEESLKALQEAIYEAICYERVKDLSDAMSDLTEHIAEINAKLTYKSYRLTPPGDFRISIKDASSMLELYKLRAVYILKRDLISRALSMLTEIHLSTTDLLCSDQEDLKSSKKIDEDIPDGELLSWDSLLERESLESLFEDPPMLAGLIPEAIINFEGLVLQEARPLQLITVLESIDKTLNVLDDEIYEKTITIQSYEEKRKSVLIKRMMVLNRLKDILADS